MTIEPEFSIVISFVCFCWIFAKKIYPAITIALDEHIANVQSKISEAERLKNEAELALQVANNRKQEIDVIIEENRLKSEEKIQKLKEESKRLVSMLRKRHELSLKTQLEAELVKQKNQLIDRLSDVILKEVSQRAMNANYYTELQEKDLLKLLESNNKSLN